VKRGIGLVPQIRKSEYWNLNVRFTGSGFGSKITEPWQFLIRKVHVHLAAKWFAQDHGEAVGIATENPGVRGPPFATRADPQFG
jgi:hypothetical protein